MLLVIGLVHGGGRWLLYGRAAAADADLDRADQAAREQYAVLCRNIERREHERLLHDTVLNTLTSVARSGGDAVAEVVARCRQDVALMEAALSADDLAPAPVTPAGDLRGYQRRRFPAGDCAECSLHQRDDRIERGGDRLRRTLLVYAKLSARFESFHLRPIVIRGERHQRCQH